MVFLKLMGLMDLLTVTTLLLFKYGIIQQKFLIVAVAYLIIKGVIFFRDIASIVDVGVAVVFILAMFGIYNVLTWIAVLWVLQKAVFSMLT
ncbi:MAG: hypothetical protein Q8N77_03395 [Nanoarchaeota archaeon]|nr:hypothetical protein [Nanoarchaeota archaeon]